MRTLRILPALLLGLGLVNTAYSLPATAQTNTTLSGKTANPQQKLLALADRYYVASAEFNPLEATYHGDAGYDDKLPMTLKPEVRARQIAFWKNMVKELKTLAVGQLSGQDRVTYDILLHELEGNLSLAAYPDHLLPINQMDSIPLTLAHFGSGQSAQPLNTPAQYDAYLSRIAHLPDWLNQATSNMRTGKKRHITLPMALVNSLLPQFKQLASGKVEDHPYYLPIINMPASFSDADKTRLREAYQREITQKTLPALKEFYQFLHDDYLPSARPSTGWGALPNGAAWYRAWVAEQTTTNLTPEQIHAIGLKEVARIQSEYAILGPKLGYHGDAQGLPGWMETQTTYRTFKTEKEILDAYKAIDQEIRKHLPTYFGKIPKAPLEIRSEPEISRETASDHYTSPALDGSRPGVFWAVINNPADYASTGMKTLYLHEGQPGHHFHLASLQELDVPKFRRVGGNVAYTEGWALYAETLGKEMGLFANDPPAYYGHLSDEMLRATRLVVDTGMHAKGWTREQGIKYLQQTLGYTEAASRQAIERYMAWPGQALGYKIGSLKIMELRHLAEAELGQRFDLRQFHDAILSDGTLPLSLLETKMRKWIAEQKSVSAGK